MSDFKLIAIKTGKGLTKNESLIVNPENWNPKQNYNFLRNLTPNETFTFFSDYSISKDSNTIIHHEDKRTPNLYELKNNPETNIEVSAIVGRNGSGKSTLIEILYLAIYNLSVQLYILFDEDKNLIHEPQTYLRCELFMLVDKNTSYKIKFHYDDDKRECYLYKSTKEGNTYTFRNTPDEFNVNDLNNLFYTISVNYSIYGLNSSQIGSWITHLFHKNDSYQTPLVINPMRTMGNFDINKENYLFKYRLLSNAVIKYKKYKKEVSITDDIHLKELIFRLNSSKIKNLESEKEYYDRGNERLLKSRTIQELLTECNFDYDIDELINKAIQYMFGGTSDNINYVNVQYEKEVKLYIVKKLYRIAFTYTKYWDYLDFETYSKPVKFKTKFKKENFENYLKVLKDDHTHVTLKLRQALNYLHNNPLKTIKNNSGTKYWFDSSITGKIYRIPFNEFAERLLGFDDKIINCLPPSLFNVIINVSEDKYEDSFDIGNLSSGQLQLIQSIQSSLYHLNNLESYYESNTVNEINYQNVLIIFDEIELYFHPEYQRKIINHFLSELDQLSFNLIKNIHIVYVTHSPFVLSDIPHTNQLNLKNGENKPVTDKTFAANIYELLKSSFYMESNVGDYSEKKIDEVLNKLNAILYLKNRNDDYKKLQELKSEFIEKEYLSIIKLIGDRIVRNKLLSIYFSCFGEDTIMRKDFLESQMRKIQSQLKDLDND